jgi:hypothetical protein
MAYVDTHTEKTAADAGVQPFPKYREPGASDTRAKPKRAIDRILLDMVNAPASINPVARLSAAWLVTLCAQRRFVPSGQRKSRGRVPGDVERAPGLLPMPPRPASRRLRFQLKILPQPGWLEIHPRRREFRPGPPLEPAPRLKFLRSPLILRKGPRRLSSRLHREASGFVKTTG